MAAATGRGSTGALLALAAGFLLLFALQRACSPFLRIESEAALAAELARSTGLGTADVMALRELLGVRRTRGELERLCTEFARRRGQVGEPLAAVSVAGHAGLVDATVAAHAGDGARAWAVFLSRPEAAWGVRFLAVRDRFAARDAARAPR